MEFKAHVFVCVCISKHTHPFRVFFPEIDGKDIIYIISELNAIVIYVDESHRRF